MNPCVFVSLELVLYIYIGRGPPLQSRRVAPLQLPQSGPTSGNRLPCFGILQMAQWIWREAPDGWQRRRRKEDKKEDVRGISVCRCKNLILKRKHYTYYLAHKKERGVNLSPCKYTAGTWQLPYILIHAWREREIQSVKFNIEDIQETRYKVYTS